MSISIPKELIIKMALPLAMDIVTDMITPDSVAHVREKIFALMRELAGKTENEIDDKVVEYFIHGAMANMAEYGDRLFDMIKNYVFRTETKYDDKTVLPVINGLRIAAGIPDND